MCVCMCMCARACTSSEKDSKIMNFFTIQKSRFQLECKFKYIQVFMNKHPRKFITIYL